jgi:hypothetical protein
MKCTTFDDRLEAYRAEDLAPAEQLEMEEHARGCPLCRGRMERAERLEAALRHGLRAVAEMGPGEQHAVRAGVLAGLGDPRARPWRRFRPVPLRLPSLSRVAAVGVSAAAIVVRAQAAIDEHAGLSGVLHWQSSLEGRVTGSDELLEYGFEMWFDFDDPRRYRLQQLFEGMVTGEMVRDGLDHLWTYSDDGPYSGGESNPTIEEIVLSPDEMRELARWHVPSPGREDLAHFADMLPDIRFVGESEMAGRRVYLLQGQLPALSSEFNEDGAPRPTKATVTLAVDAETYWLLGREEQLVSEERPRIRYRTERFELLPRDQVPEGAFAFSPPPGVPIRKMDGIDSVYRTPKLPSMSVDEAVALAHFALQLPTELPGDMEALPYVLADEALPEELEAGPDLIVIYRGAPGRQMLLVESPLPTGPALLAQPVRVGEREGWLESDLIDARQFTIHLADWGVPARYATPAHPAEEEAPTGRLPPGHVMLHAWGLSVDEAVAVLASLMPYVP